MTAYQRLVTIGALLLAITLAAFPTGRRAIAWAYVEVSQPIQKITHPSSFSLDRLDPTCPQCM